MFKIGDFSKLSRISVRMLRYYDTKGLLKPNKVDAFTGYRYYSAEQIHLINKIHAMKEMGFNVSEIKILISNKNSDDQILALLNNRKREIINNVKEEEEKLSKVNTLIKMMNLEDNKMKYEIAVKSMPKQKVISLRDIIPKYEDEGILWQELQEFCKEKDIKPDGPIYAIYHDEGYKESNVDVELAMVLNKELDETDRIKNSILEKADKMAVIMHRGKFEEMTKAYEALGTWLESNDYGIYAPTRVIYHKGPWSENNPEDYLTEIQAPIKKQ